MTARCAVGIAVLLCCSAAWAAAKKPLAPAQREQNLQSFEYVWTTIRDKHWDPKLGGLDWQAVHDQLRPKMERAETMRQAREVLSDMVGRLHQSHFSIIPAEVYRDMGQPTEAHDGVTGIEARVFGGKALVTAVQKDSPAETQGVRPGWEILGIGGKDLAPSLKKIAETYRDSTLLEAYLSASVASKLSGIAGEPVPVEFLDGADKRVNLQINRATPRGIPTKFGYLRSLYFWAEARKLQSNIGYLRFNMFFDPEDLVAQVGNLVKSCRQCDGVIIDLRGNPGGIGGLAMGVAGWFIHRPNQRLGTMYLRGNILNFVVFPRLEAYRGPLAILVDGCSASTAEIFAGGLKDLGRARIFGARTAGAALPSVIERLPDGDGFQYAIANYISEGGKPLEGVGVIPDVEVTTTRAQLLEGRDPVLDAAVQWVKSRKR